MKRRRLRGSEGVEEEGMAVASTLQHHIKSASLDHIVITVTLHIDHQCREERPNHTYSDPLRLFICQPVAESEHRAVLYYLYNQIQHQTPIAIQSPVADPNQ